MDDLCEAIEKTLISNEYSDDTNITDAVLSLSANASKIAKAIYPSDAISGIDATGGHVCSLTESVMGITKSLMAIASAIDGLSDAIRERNEQQTQ